MKVCERPGKFQGMWESLIAPLAALALAMLQIFEHVQSVSEPCKPLRNNPKKLKRNQKIDPKSKPTWDPLENEKLRKSIPKTFQNPPQNVPNSTQKRSKIHPKMVQNRGLKGTALRIAVGILFFLRLGASWAALRASWGRPGAVLGRLGRVLGRLGGILGASCGILGRLGRVLERLGGVLGASWGVLDPLGTAKRCIPSWSPRSDRFLVDF